MHMHAAEGSVPRDACLSLRARTGNGVTTAFPWPYMYAGCRLSDQRLIIHQTLATRVHLMRAQTCPIMKTTFILLFTESLETLLAV